MTTINGRTPEEIKKGLEKCPNADCSLCLSSFHCDLEAEALEYIQQLERERDEARNDLDTINYANTELHSAYEAMKRERDAAVEDIHEAARTGCLCYTCTHNRKGHCIAFDHGIFEATVMCGQYKWRGVPQEVE